MPRRIYVSNQLLVDLLAATARQDRVAFRALYDATSSILYRVAVLVTRRRDAAEDSLQDAYIRIWRSAGTFDGRPDKALSWLTMIARHSAIDTIRADTFRDAVPDADLEQLPDPHDALALLLDEERRDQLLRALGAMPPRKRDLIVAAYLNGETRDAMATRLGSSPNTVKTWLRRACGELRAAMLAAPEADKASA
ncbi:MAG: sigma-70 family RNA polymerase sigma factor [Alsobacter sp.]